MISCSNCGTFGINLLVTSTSLCTSDCCSFRILISCLSNINLKYYIRLREKKEGDKKTTESKKEKIVTSSFFLSSMSPLRMMDSCMFDFS